MNVMSRTPINSTKTPDLSLRYDLMEVPGTNPTRRVCVTQNPDPLSGKALGPYNPDGSPRFTGQCTISCQMNGDLEARPGVVVADFELPSVDGAGSVVFWPGQGGIGDVPLRGTCYKFLGALNIPENK